MYSAAFDVLIKILKGLSTSKPNKLEESVMRDPKVGLVGTNLLKARESRESLSAQKGGVKGKVGVILRGMSGGDEGV